MSELSECMIRIVEPYNFHIVLGIVVVGCFLTLSFIKDPDPNRSLIQRIYFPTGSTYAWGYWLSSLVLIVGGMTFWLLLGKQHCELKF